jgi:hemolysin activation/secretion protein
LRPQLVVFLLGISSALLQPAGAFADATPSSAPADLAVNIKIPASCFEIKRLEWRGFSALGREQLKAIEKQALPGCLTALQIRGLQMRIQGAYADAGYLMARVTTPNQNLAGGALQFAAEEGFLERIDSERLAIRGASRSAAAFVFMQGSPIRIQDVDRGVALLNRVPSANVTAKLLPGSVDGATVLVLEEEAGSPWRVRAGVDNEGQKETGLIRGRLQIERDNLIGWNDTWVLTALPSKRTSNYSLVSSAGAGAWVGGFNTGRSAYGQDIKTGVRVTGITQTAAASLERKFVKTAQSELTANVELARKKSSRAVEGAALIPQILAPLRVALNYSYRDKHAYLATDLSATQGLGLFNAVADPAVRDRDVPRGRFRKYELGLQYGLQFSAVSYGLQLRAQAASDALFPSEQIVAAGAQTVRGLPDGALAGNSGAYARNDFGFGSLGSWIFAGRLGEPYLIVDAGQTRNWSGVRRSAASSGIGLRQQSGSVKWNAVIAKPVYGQGIEKSGWRLHAVASWEIL